MTEMLTRETTAGSSRESDYLDRVRSIADLVRAEAEAIERDRTITKPVAAALVELGLHELLIPEELGGGGLLPSEALRVYEEMAKCDASVGWAWMASSWATAGVLGHLQPHVVAQLMSTDGGFIVAGQLLPRYPAVQVDGGYIIDGDYSFASGSDHATWIGAGFLVADENGNLILGEDGQPQARIALLPKDEVEIKNNWDVWGLAGTGSHDYTISKQFVPAEFTTPTFGGTPVRSETLYKLTNEFAGGLPHAPIVLGIATRALELVAELTAGKMRPNYTIPVGDAEIFRIDFARKDASLQAARLYCHEIAESAEATVNAGRSVTPEDIARVKQMLAWVHEVTADIVEFAHRWGGSRSIGRTSTLGRYVRDMHVATQHLLVDPKMLVDAAEVLLPIYTHAAARA
ncbi:MULTISPECIES: acyl-CoA dehydrogenase family protein [unclassified Rhodococcus (in: high G+C Gram-positive bacteria)]|uniref:acyl-CoA dehydrogenase family protein n=1 Tax=unclassified Rhodococcus (in: high G+C Gram-positive bacteria) TaxID=192944 RepID=UPI00163B4191|nr:MULTISPECIES: acyl-CoA dehydrogenase family protein [unclassified Rhodococcus (in: high G+C Gram-positive bacteria)]MBC2637668.1 acyl-CoA dehydrogenase family protein [Rhodococcus sp. 3A]MBC2897588.1 acyl-CoA dehydrogenase family protein [Rhodococcus sp. 4CII]